MINHKFPDKLYQIAAQPENTEIQRELIEKSVEGLLKAIGENPQREGIKKTPRRIYASSQELFAGYTTDLDALFEGAVFQDENDDMVMMKHIEFYSMCEHHLVPFFGQVHVAYQPDGKIIGASKIPQIINLFARRLQIQERLNHQVAAMLDALLEPKGLVVVMDAMHLCVSMRGVKNQNARLVTSSVHGCFKQNNAILNSMLTL